MSERKNGCPFRHEFPIDLGHKRGTRYGEIEDFARIARRDIPLMLTKSSRQVVKNYDPKEDSSSKVADIWTSQTAKTLCSYVDLIGFSNPEIRLGNLQDYLRSDANNSLLHILKYHHIPKGWLIAIAEGGILDTTAGMLYGMYSKISITEKDNFKEIKLAIDSQNENESFSREAHGLQIVCKGQAIARAVSAATSLNLKAKKESLNFYIEPFTIDYKSKSLDTIFEEYKSNLI